MTVYQTEVSSRIESDGINGKYKPSTTEAVNGMSSKNNLNVSQNGQNESQSIGSLLKECRNINKPMIPLKIALFLWYGGGAVLIPFFNIYFFQLGITVAQFSYMLTLNPILQFIGPTLCGIIADKIGRTKPVLVANIVLTAFVVNGILFVPPVSQRKCYNNDIEIFCKPHLTVRNIDNFTREASNCFVKCQNGDASYAAVRFDRNYGKESFGLNDSNFPVPESVLSYGNWTAHEATAFTSSFNNPTSFCESIMRNDCVTFCTNNISNEGNWAKLDCPDVDDNTSLVFTVCLILSCLFAMVISNCYRFMDVTAMAMVKTYNSDLGRERFWAILSVAILSPIAGYLVDLTTPKGAPRNCAFAFYLFDGILVLMLVVFYKLEVQINPPGQNMGKKALKLLKNLDIVTFALAVLVLGTSWGFTKIYSFIYLDKLGSPSILIGFLLTVNSLSGLPFLLTSNWWIETLGSSNVLVCGFLGYIFLSLGFSFIVNPWHALIYETSAIFTYHLLWVAVIRHSHEVAPVGLTATVVSCAGGIHYALGKGTGSLIGGLVMSKYGGRWAFRLIAIICAFTALIYSTYIYIRKTSNAKKTLKNENLELENDLPLPSAYKN